MEGAGEAFSPAAAGLFFAIANHAIGTLRLGDQVCCSLLTWFACRSAVHALESKTPERIALRCVFDGLLKQMTAVAVRLNSECSENDCTEEEKYGANRKRIES